MNILGRTQMIYGADSYEDAVRRIRASGFDGAEIDIYDRNFQIRQEFFEPDFPRKMAEYISKYDIKTISVGAHLNYTESEESFQLIQNAVRVTEAIGAKVMIITGAHKKADESFGMQWKRQIKYMKKLGRFAEDYNIDLAIEFEPGYVIDNTSLLLDAISEVNSPVFKINADIGHMFLQDEDPLDSIRKCGELIVHGHVENMQKGIHNHLVPWEGDMDLGEYAEKLRSVGFNGPVSLDLYQYDYEMVAEESLKYLKQYF